MVLNNIQKMYARTIISELGSIIQSHVITKSVNIIIDKNSRLKSLHSIHASKLFNVTEFVEPLIKLRDLLWDLFKVPVIIYDLFENELPKKDMGLIDTNIYNLYPILVNLSLSKFNIDLDKINTRSDKKLAAIIIIGINHQYSIESNYLDLICSYEKD